MSTITKEWLQRLIRAIDSENFDEEEIVGWVNSDEIMELARIALASLEAEAGEYLTHVVDDGYGEFSDRMNFSLPVGTKLYTAPPAPANAEPVAWRYRTTDINGNPNPHWSFSEEASLMGLYQPLYAAPPLPVAVTDERAAFNAWNNDTDCPLAGRDAKTAAWLAWSRRAAMLQGADGNSPVLPDGWAMVPKEPTSEMQSAAAGAIRFDTTPINKLWTGNAVYKAMLAAAPQQEVK